MSACVVPLAILLLASTDTRVQPQTRALHDAQAGRAKVVTIEIEGARGVSEASLKALLETRKNPWLPWRDEAYFDADVFEADLRRIEAFYGERGFPHARAEGVVEPRADERVGLRIIVHEGEPVRATDIVFRGFDVLSTDQVNAIRGAAALQPEAPIANATVQQTARLAVTALWNAGYAYARVDVLETPIAPNRVLVEFSATPGAQAAFGRIDVAGNVSVEDSVIRRELTYVPGERFQMAAVDESRRRLFRLGLFESVDVKIDTRERPAAGVPTVITVKERDHTQFTYAFGYGSEEQLYGEAGFRHLNFLGDGRSASTRGRWSWLDRGAEGAFVQPYLFGSPVTLTVRAHVWQLDEAPYEALSFGGRAGASYPVGRSTFSVTYTRQRETVKIPADVEIDPGALAQFTSFGFDAVTGEQEGMLSALQLGATHDGTVDSEGNIRGYAVTARVERAGDRLGGSFDYINVHADGRYYHALRRATLAGRVQYGSIDPTASRSAVPFSRRYFLGGSDSLRGWGRLEVSPLSAAGLPIGGESLFLMNGELRFPVIGPLGAVAFADAGQVWENSWSLARDLHADAGVGVRYASPFGLLRVDVGHQLTRLEGLRIRGEPRERRWRIHVGIGHAF